MKGEEAKGETDELAPSYRASGLTSRRVAGAEDETRGSSIRNPKSAIRNLHHPASRAMNLCSVAARSVRTRPSRWTSAGSRCSCQGLSGMLFET